MVAWIFYLRDWVWPLKYKLKKINVKERTGGNPPYAKFQQEPGNWRIGTGVLSNKYQTRTCSLESDTVLAFGTEWEPSFLTVHWRHHQMSTRILHLKTPQGCLLCHRWAHWRWGNTSKGIEILFLSTYCLPAQTRQAKNIVKANLLLLNSHS